MARPARGEEVLEKARQMLSKATAIDELRILQAVVLPLANGMSTEETARTIGRSPRWVTSARNEFIRNAGIQRKVAPQPRNRAHLTKDEETAFLEPFFEKAQRGGILVVSEIHNALRQRLGRKVALATAYNLLHRHGWRKLAPDKRHVKADKQAQDDWKKNFQSASRKLKKNGTDPALSG
jgi:transposase